MVGCNNSNAPNNHKTLIISLIYAFINFFIIIEFKKYILIPIIQNTENERVITLFLYFICKVAKEPFLYQCNLIGWKIKERMRERKKYEPS